jgi:hypothetical protein
MTRNNWLLARDKEKQPMLVTGVGGQKRVFILYDAHNTACNIVYIHLKYLGTFFFLPKIPIFWVSLML